MNRRMDRKTLYGIAIAVVVVILILYFLFS